MANTSTQDPTQSNMGYSTLQQSSTGSASPQSQTDMRRGNMPANPRPEHSEGQIARTIEEQTAKLPSDTFLWAALGSMAVSAALQIAGNQKTSLFVGQWAPSFLLLGLYNKLVKVAGSDGQSAGQQWHKGPPL
jgi:hypothetical protein